MSTAAPATGRPYVLPEEVGVVDLWWPYQPVVGRYTLKVCGDQTDGRLTQMLMTDSRGAGTPVHIHHDADETFLVLEGELAFLVGDERITAGPGDFVFAPMGVPHAFCVTSETARAFVTSTPGGQRGPAGHGMDGFFREVAVPVGAPGGRPEPRVPDAEDFGVRMARYGLELVGPPPVFD
jgi:quercetin dioxygenase-like cupin family protein